MANATLQLRVTVVRLFYDFLVEERVRDRNPVARGYRSADGRAGRRGLVARLDPLPWIPTDAQWRAVLEVAAGESLRNRLMLALAYDAALRREELCLLATDDLDPAHRTITVRAETTKSRRGAGRAVLGGRRSAVGRISAASPGDHDGAWRVVRVGVAAQPGGGGVAVDVVEGGAVDRAAGGGAVVQHAHAPASVPDRSGSVGLGASSDRDRSPGTAATDTTQRYIHLSGRDLADRLASGMTQIHARADRAARRGARDERVGGSMLRSPRRGGRRCSDAVAV